MEKQLKIGENWASSACSLARLKWNVPLSVNWVVLLDHFRSHDGLFATFETNGGVISHPPTRPTEPYEQH